MSLATGWPWRVLDRNAVAEQYVLAVEFRRGAREAAVFPFAIKKVKIFLAASMI